VYPLCVLGRRERLQCARRLRAGLKGSDFAQSESDGLQAATSALKPPSAWALAIALAAVGMLACGRTAQPAVAPVPRPQTSFADYVPDNPMVHQEGMALVGPDGDRLTLRGVNLGGWLLWEGWEYGKGSTVSETEMLRRLTDLVGAEATLEFQRGMQANFITEADIQAIARLGFNSVRLPFNAKLLEDGEAPCVYRPEGWAVLDQALAWCERNGVYVILDLHAVPGGQSRLTPSDPGPREQMIWSSAEARRRTVALWRAIAERYRERTIVAAYDLINEPLPPRGKESMLYELTTQIVAAIREVDPYHLIVVEGGRFSSDFSMFPGPVSGNQMYGFHMYTWFGDNRAEAFANLRSVTQSHGVPLWAGEFGENDYETIASTVRMYADPANEITGGWSFWPWKKVPVRNPALVEIHPPDNWTAVINWIGNPKRNPRPTPVQAQAGMQAFLEAVRFENTTIDARMLGALTGHAAPSVEP